MMMFKRSFNTRKSLTVSLALAATFCFAGQSVAADSKDAAKEAKCSYSSKFVEKYKPAQDAAAKGDWASVLPAAKDAYAAAKLPCEQLLAVGVQRSAAANLKNNDELVASARLMNTVPGVPDKDRIVNLQVIYQTLINTKDYDNAMPALKAYIDATPPLASNWDLMLRLQYQQKDCAGAIESFNKLVAIEPGSEQNLLMAQDCYYKSKQSDLQAKTTQELLTRFPKESYMIGVLAASQDQDERQLLNLYRLAFSRDFLTRQAQIVDFAGLSDRAGIPGEAVRVLDKAAVEKWITLDDKNSKLLASEKRNAADDKKSLPALDKEAKAGKSGKKDVAVGYAQFGMEDYSSAVDSLKRGLSADRVSDVARVDDANMVLGIALLRLNRQDEAMAAFTAAKADPRMAKAATLWMSLAKP